MSFRTNGLQQIAFTDSFNGLTDYIILFSTFTKHAIKGICAAISGIALGGLSAGDTLLAVRTVISPVQEILS